ncbi:type 4a pilus biogenesis protein PilO [Nannocystis bainbridge]|uniref:Type 4a pilus biogenesis protein PilO n=1 Tax=Nannocystis bainbridge TaxID=2995303 RepID=A0ABT5EAP5_9BACT|nr:type 4a pilus biogenesis protein PilO [Nannocystis bainbridge]MDC0721846.1 type 4a pilus biogenesis protein PilO [Nannocystis bainbridge]
MLSPESLTRLSVLQTLLIWGLGASVTAIVGYVLFFVPARADLLAARNELAAAEARRDRVTQELAEQQTFAAALAADEVALTLALAATPGAAGDRADLLFIVPALARDSGLEIDRWQPLPDEPAGEWGVRSPVRVDARGGWDALVRFVTALAALPETVVLDELALRWPAEDGALEISFRAGALRVRAELAEPPAHPSAPSPVPR